MIASVFFEEAVNAVFAHVRVTISVVTRCAVNSGICQHKLIASRNTLDVHHHSLFWCWQ